MSPKTKNKKKTNLNLTNKIQNETGVKKARNFLRNHYDVIRSWERPMARPRFCRSANDISCDDHQLLPGLPGDVTRNILAFYTNDRIVMRKTIDFLSIMWSVTSYSNFDCFLRQNGVGFLSESFFVFFFVKWLRKSQNWFVGKLLLSRAYV